MAATNSEALRVDDVLAQIKAAYELKDHGALTDAEFNELKSRLLATTKAQPPASVGSAREIANEPIFGSAEQTIISLYAGDLHRAIVDQIYKTHPGPEEDARSYMNDIISQLVSYGALKVTDVPHLRKIIDIVCDKDYGDSDETMVDGMRRISLINDRIRIDMETSQLAKTISGITLDSAQNAALNKIVERDDLAQPPAPPPQPLAPQQRWSTVAADVGGALTGASTVASMLAIPGAPGAAAFLTAALGPVAVLVMPVVSAITCAGVTSGIEYARVRARP